MIPSIFFLKHVRSNWQQAVGERHCSAQGGIAPGGLGTQPSYVCEQFQRRACRHLPAAIRSLSAATQFFATTADHQYCSISTVTF